MISVRLLCSVYFSPGYVQYFVFIVYTFYNILTKNWNVFVFFQLQAEKHTMTNELVLFKKKYNFCPEKQSLS